MYNVQVTKKAAKFLRNMPENYKNAILGRLKELENELMPRGSIHLEGKENSFRIRIGPFRVLYRSVKEEKVIIVYMIKRRNETTYQRSGMHLIKIFPHKL